MRKLICLALALVMLLSVVAVAFAAENKVMGDVNNDGSVNNVDAMLVLQYAVGLNTSVDTTVGDVNGDGSVNNVDAMMILQYSVGLLTKFPADKEEETPVVEINDISNPATVEVGAGKKVNVTGRIFGVIMTIENAADASVTFNGTTYTADANGVLTVEFPEAAMGPMTPAVEFELANNGSAAASYVLSFEYPVGTYMNPEIIYDVTEIQVAIAEGNTQGYYYCFYNRGATGDVSLSVASATEGVEYDVILTNKTSGDMAYLSDSKDGTVSIAVVPRDEVVIQVVVSPDANWNYPAADITLSGELIAPVGSYMNPEKLSDLSEINVSIAEGNDQGYYYSFYNNAATGTLSFSVASATEGVEYGVILTNKTTNESKYLADSTDGTVAIELVPFTEYGLQVAVEPDMETWTYPAAEIKLVSEIIYPAGTQMNPASLVIGANSAKIEAGSQGYFYTWTATGDGELTVTMDASNANGWNFNLYNLTSYAMTDILTSEDGDTATLAVSTGDEVQVTVNTFDANDPWNTPAGTVAFQASFAAAEAGGNDDNTGDDNQGGDGNTGSEIPDSTYKTLSVGSNTVTLDASGTTIFEFTPSEAGEYTFTVPSGSVVGYWGGNEFFLTDPNSTASTCKWTCTGAGQSAYIGVSGGTSVTVTVTKSTSGGSSSSTYIEYQNVHTPEPFAQTLSGKKDVDITKSHTAVLGSDGYYHLDSADGAILYANLKDPTWDFVGATQGAFTLRGITDDSVKYEFLTAMKAYAEAVSTEGYYPLTEDLIVFFKAWGNAQGWWNASFSPFAAIKNGNANADSMWMVLCVTAN